MVAGNGLSRRRSWPMFMAWFLLVGVLRTAPPASPKTLAVDDIPATSHSFAMAGKPRCCLP